MKMLNSHRITAALCFLTVFFTGGFVRSEDSVKEEHSGIGIPTGAAKAAAKHTQHPDAQWFPGAGFGLFLHWGICTVKELNISWSMIPGRALGKERISDAAELERIIREQDYNLNGRKPEITPNEYWALAKEFNPQKYDPEKWCKAAKEAGFTYIVLTTRHHDGFSMWPSDADDFSTKNFMGGRDLVKPFVEACRKYGLKAGLYYSPPNWYFERAWKNFLYHKANKLNPGLPELDADLKPRKDKPGPPADSAARYDALVRKQVTELLTRYGKINLIWFDGVQPTPNGKKCITAEEIRKLQPGILINPRLHGTGDFITYERELTTNKIATTWAEFCNTWATLWPYQNGGFRSNGFALGQLARSRALGINCLLGIGPDAQGEFHPDVYKNMAILSDWMKKNGEAVHAVKPLPAGESSNVPATALGSRRFLFACPEFTKKDGKPGMFESEMMPPGDVTLTLKGVQGKPVSVKLLGDGAAIPFDYASATVTVRLPAARRTRLTDVVQIDLAARPPSNP